jgi:hypothetical protein
MHMNLSTRIDMSVKLVAFNIFVIPLLVAAGEKNVTIDSETYSAIGYSENEAEQLAKQDACNAARRELIGYVFGAAYQINQNMIRSLGVLDYSQDVSVNTGEIVIRGAITETSKEGRATKCTITYPIKEAELEKARLKSSNSFKTNQFTDIGNVNEVRGGVLEVVTIPDDADVFIDNQRWGTTPLRLNSKLAVGSRLIRIEHENYKTVEITKEIGLATKTRVEQILRRATGKLRIITDPDNATVLIDGQNIGQSPTGEIEILSGHKAKIEVSHPEANTTIQTVSVVRDEVRTLNLRLQLKPSFFSVHVKPTGATVRLDDDRIIAADEWVSADAGPHKLTISKEGYESTTATFHLLGGEKKTLPSIDLRLLSEVELQEKSKKANPWYFGFELSASPANSSGFARQTTSASANGLIISYGQENMDSLSYLSYGGWVAKRYGWIGVRTGFNLQQFSDKGSSAISRPGGAISMNGYDINVSIPLYYKIESAFDSFVSIAPGIGMQHQEWNISGVTIGEPSLPTTHPWVSGSVPSTKYAFDQKYYFLRLSAEWGIFYVQCTFGKFQDVKDQNLTGKDTFSTGLGLSFIKF